MSICIFPDCKNKPVYFLRLSSLKPDVCEEHAKLAVFIGTIIKIDRELRERKNDP